MPKVCIIYGFAEGPKTAARLRASLATGRFTVVESPEEADILVVHSGGYHLLPMRTENQIVLLAGPSNGYQKSWLPTQMHKVYLDLRHCLSCGQLTWWLYKSFWNTVYIFAQHKQHKVMLNSLRQFGKKLPPIRAKKLAIVLYKDDPWSWFMDKSNPAAGQKEILLSHPGIHDDLWMNPDEYVRVLKYLYET